MSDLTLKILLIPSKFCMRNGTKEQMTEVTEVQVNSIILLLSHIFLILIIHTFLNCNDFKILRHSLSLLGTLSEDCEKWKKKYKKAKVRRMNVPERT